MKKRIVDIPLIPVFQPFFKPSRYKGAYGGRGSAKSHSFADLLIDRCLSKHGTRAVCVREVQQSLEQSVKRLLEDKITGYDLGRQFKVMNTHIETPGDGIVIFQGMSTTTKESIKSLEGYDIAWCEEAQSLSQASLDLLRPTIREPGSELWFSWNPRKPTDPVERLLRSEPPMPDAIVIRSTYRDNPYFSDVLRHEMQWDKARDPEKYAHVWLGEYERSSEARVFKNWRVETFETPDDANFLQGGDWGFSVDPTAAVRGFVKPTEPRTLYIDAEAYRVGCEIDHSPALFDAMGCRRKHTHAIQRLEADLLSPYEYDLGHVPDPCENTARRWPMVADSARPETISYMQRHGYPMITPAVKGPNSVEEGIEFLKSYDIVVHSRCIHTIDELTAYSFKRHPLTNEVLPILADKKNHLIDSLRYMCESLRTPRQDSSLVW